MLSSRAFSLIPLSTAICVLALNVVSAQSEEVLKGKVERVDQPTRIRRPILPAEIISAVNHTDPASKPLQGNVQTKEILEDEDFSNFHKLSPLRDGTVYGAGTAQAPKTAQTTEDLLQAEAQNNEMIIAWEEWHRRVCTAIFARWRQNGTLPGVAHTTLRFTRDRHIELIFNGVEVGADAYEVLPYGSHFTEQELQQAFMRTVRQSVSPLDGDLVLEFPTKSRRQVVEFSPAFRGTNGPAGYNWKKNDYERVPVN